MKRGGLSKVVTSLIMILLVLIALGVIWVVISNLLQTSSEKISISDLTSNLEIQKVTLDQGTYNVQVKRTSGKEEISKIKIILSDGKTSEIFENLEGIGEIEVKNYPLTPENLGLITSVSVVPTFKDGEKEVESNKPIEKEVSKANQLESMGAIAWWEFEGNAEDSIGENDGTCTACPDYIEGKNGRAVDFDGTQAIIVPNSDSLHTPTQLTWIAWINLTKTNWNDRYERWATIFAKQNYWEEEWFSIYSGKQIICYLDNNKGKSINTITPNRWEQIAIKWNGSEAHYYLNGEQIYTQYYSGKINQRNTPLTIGANGANTNYHWVGQIDDIMIFNRSLSDAEIKQIYNS